MKLIKSLLLGTAAGFAATAGVQAADLPSKKAAPVDYVRVCTIGSFTGFVIPGSDVCLKVGGFVRYQYTYTQPQSGFFYVPGVGGYAGTAGRFQNAGTGQQAQASVKMDARTTTEYGLLRSFFDLRIGQNSPTGAGGVGAGGGSNPYIDKAYIQFGPWSFGKFQSFFDFYADAYNNIGQLGSDTSVVGAAYTFNAGNGFFATLALEDRGNATPLLAVATPTVGGLPVGFPGTGPGTITPFFPGAAIGSNAGYRVPDAVVQFLYDPGASGWGSAQLSGAVHQIRSIYGVSPILGDPSGVETKYGWAVQGGVKFNLGMLGAGDTAYIQAAYAEGAMSYIGASPTAGNGGVTQLSNILGVADAVITYPGSVKLTKGYNVLAAIDHYWTPSFDTALYAGYTKVDYASGALTGPLAPVAFTAPDFNYWQVGAQATWVPVKGLKFAGTLNYYRIDRSAAIQDFATVGGVTYRLSPKDSDAVAAAIRIQRDF